MKKKAILILILVGVIAVAFGPRFWTERGADSEHGNSIVHGSAQENDILRDPVSSGLLEDPYSVTLASWEDVPDAAVKRIVLKPAEQEANRAYAANAGASFGYGSAVVRWEMNTELVVDVTVPETGLYIMGFDHYVIGESILPSEGYIKIDGIHPFYEARRIIFQSLWSNIRNQSRVDRYGNELPPNPEKIGTWQSTYAYDASYFHTNPLKFKLEKGKHQITLTNTRGDLLLGNVYLEPPAEIDTYEQYRAELPEDDRSIKGMIRLEGEDFTTKSDLSIRSASERDLSLTPYHTTRRLINILEGDSWKKGGQAVTWEFDMEESGYYDIGIKFKQEKKLDLPVFRTIEINGKVPFAEVENYPFHYGAGWQNETLGGDDGSYRFYFEKGKNTMTMRVNLSNLRPLAEEITETMIKINRLTLEIQKLTGNKTDRYRDWSLNEYIPNIDDRLLQWADNLEREYVRIHTLNGSVDNIGEVMNLKMIVKQLRNLAKEPDQLPNQLNMLSQGSGSVAQMLGNLMQRISESPLSIDTIYLYSDKKLPAPKSGLAKRVAESSKRFIFSFGKQQYSTVAENKGKLEVWVNRPRQYVELMQKMIDENFTPETGVQVKLSIMPDESKLILANASNASPDVALGVSSSLPYEFAIRDAVKDLRQFPDFDDVAQDFSKGAMIAFAFENGVYALPETQNFNVTFYRKDIMDSLDIPVPDTWDDVIKILPELQRLGMNFYSPISMHGGFKPFDATTPFIYQFGGELFGEDGMTTAIDDEDALKGINFMTELFTIYNVPQSVPNFYHHFRYGTLPVGISDFNTYVQLRTTAPEIANWWKIAPSPGVERDGKIERWSPAGGQVGMIFEDTDYAEQSWQFLKWWLSEETQVEFANILQSTYGEAYMWNTANLNAFDQLPWPEEDKAVILEQFGWAREASRVPGAYMVERELSNVWNKVVFNGANPRTSIDDAVIIANREIKRKMKEFGYWDGSTVIKPYPVPTIFTIDKWVENNNE